ncbi:MAG: P1 family peptidase [Trueperaceae bacterium]|nr:P1 family peptidase [Trueperaceae bacterium]
MTRDAVRARDLGVPFDGDPGPLNAVTDVPGVEVGHVTRIEDLPARDDAPGGVAVRTGVTALHPLGRGATEGVMGGFFSLNGNGEMTGTAFLDEFGTVFGPVVSTNTLNVGTARDAVAAWCRARIGFGHAVTAGSLPVAAETWDGKLNDIFGGHVRAEHVHRALDAASAGPVAEGNVGGGTGMTAYDFKAGIGTASRRVATTGGPYTLGVLVQANYGKRPHLRIAGVPVGREIPEAMPTAEDGAEAGRPAGPDGSIIAMVVTDAPLLPVQLRAVAKRVALGLGRNGSIAAHSSGDLFLAMSTANRVAYDPDGVHRASFVPSERLDPVYEATVQASEEAVVNALVAARTMTGAGGVTYYALPHARLQEVLHAYGRLAR